MISQNIEIIHYLQMGNRLTPLDALNKFGCFRLGARIHDLKQEGYKIHTKIVKKGNKRVAEYSILKEEPTGQFVF